MRTSLEASGVPQESQLSRTTRLVSNAIQPQGISFTNPSDIAASLNPSFAKTPVPDSIDYYIQQDLKANQVTPADKTDDYTFIRRITLDLTGRIPRRNALLLL